MSFVENLLSGPRARLIRAIMPDYPPLAEKQKDIVHGDTVIYVTKALSVAPLYIRSAIAVLDILFVIFSSLPVPSKNASLAVKLALWGRLSSFSATHERFYRSMGLLAIYEHPLILQELGFGDRLLRTQNLRAQRAQQMVGSAS